MSKHTNTFGLMSPYFNYYFPKGLDKVNKTHIIYVTTE